MAILELECTIQKPYTPMDTNNMAQAVRLRVARDPLARSKPNINSEAIVEMKLSRYTPPQAEGQSRTFKVLDVAHSVRRGYIYELQFDDQAEGASSLFVEKAFVDMYGTSEMIGVGVIVNDAD
jgi:hypothetical protein